jgi:acyl-CoA reductase-like NAD-dependent aldehyde dehydrogenase
MPDILTVTSPFDRHFIREFSLAGDKEIEQALDRAYKLFRDPSRHLQKFQRIEILEKLAALMSAQVEELTRIAAEEGGKPYKDSKVEVIRAINGIKLAVAELYNMRGEEIPMGMTAASVNRLAFTTREPIGVVLAISAFNHPLNLIVHQVIPAIAAGCPVIVKPASSTPVSCFNLVSMLYDAGLPPDYCTPLVCSRHITEEMASDPRVNYLTFIGSHEVGWLLRSNLAPGTRVALEHGGAAPVIVNHDADLREVVPGLLKAGFYHAGQVCVSAQRIFAHENIAGLLAETLAEGAEKLVTGDPLDPATDVGPLITTGDVIRIKEWVTEAEREGGQIICGGHILSDTMFAPTIVYDPPAEVRISAHEVFGPVVAIYPFSDINEAIQRSNSLRFAFQAAIYTGDIDAAMLAASRLNASAVMINDHTAFRVDWMPFGGRDESGIGTGGIPYSMKEMTREKLIVIKSRNLH